MTEEQGSQPGRNWAAAAAVVVGATTLVYLWLIENRSTRDLARVSLVAALFLLALAAAIGAATLRTPEARHLAAAGGIGLLLSMGVLAIFSVGSFLLVAAGLLIIAIAVGRAGGRRSSPIAVLLAFVVGAAVPWALVLLA
ncbi:MAG: hypothetical protein WEE66_11825 [Actinomycetota bacterium]